jgi:hypothetical protein
MAKIFITPFLLLAFSVSSLQAQSGITWNGGSTISNSTYSNLHPRMTLDRAGNPLVVWGRMSDQSCFFSRWDGTKFTTPIKLNGTMTIATATWMGPDIASHGDTVYVVMKQTPESNISSHIYITRSFNGGVTFSVPERVSFIADSIARFPTVTTDALGNPIVAFMKFNKSFMDSRWVVTKSTDKGNTFSADVKASGWGGSDEVCDCCPGAIVSNGNMTAMLYRDNNKNNRDNWMGISSNGSASFTGGCNIDNNNWIVTSCPSSGPDGIVIGDTVYSTFMSSGSGSYRTYFSKASLSNTSTGSVSRLTGAIAGLTQQNYPRIASGGNALGIVWKQNVSGSSQLLILFTNNIASGFPTTYDTVDLADITNADIAISKDQVFVIWEDDNAQTVKYRKGTFLQNSTLGITPFSLGEKLGVKIFPNPATNLINIELSTESAQLIVMNLLGEQIFSNKIGKNTRLNVSKWNSGMYIISIQAGKSTFTQKFIKE